VKTKITNDIIKSNCYMVQIDFQNYFNINLSDKRNENNTYISFESLYRNIIHDHSKSLEILARM